MYWVRLVIIYPLGLSWALSSLGTGQASGNWEDLSVRRKPQHKLSGWKKGRQPRTSTELSTQSAAYLCPTPAKAFLPLHTQVLLSFLQFPNTSHSFQILITTLCVLRMFSTFPPCSSWLLRFVETLSNNLASQFCEFLYSSNWISHPHSATYFVARPKTD